MLTGLERKTAALEAELASYRARESQLTREAQQAKDGAAQAREQRLQQQQQISQLEQALTASIQELHKGNDVIRQLHERNAELTAAVQSRNQAVVKVCLSWWVGKDNPRTCL